MLKAKDFRDQAIQLISKWNEKIGNEFLNNTLPWQWIEVKQLNNESKGYLTTKRYHEFKLNNNDSTDNENNNIIKFNNDEIIIEDDESTSISSNNNNNKIIFQFDIIYSKTYQVPVLYLNAFFSNNSLPLSWNDIWNNLPLSNFDKDQKSTTIPYITQVEHPILGNPCYQLHPCETDNLMKLVLLKQKKEEEEEEEEREYFKDYYLLSWLSIIGPMVNIKIPFELLKETTKTTI